MKRRLTRAHWTGLMLALLIAGPVPAQQVFTPSFADAELQDVIQIVAEATGRSIITGPGIANQRISFFNDRPMTEDELWQAFLRMLQVNQLVASEAGGIWSIIQEPNMRSEASPVFEGSGSEVVSRVITVENLQATQLVPILRPMMPQNAQLGAPANTNQLILVDRADNVERMAQIVEILDQANAQEIQVVQMRYASADDVSQKVTALAQAQAGGQVVALQAIPDERTNSVILTGTPNQLEYFREVAESLDLPSLQGSGSQVRYLYYAEAEDVAEILQAQFGGTQLVEDAETVTDLTGGAVSVVPHVGTNSLVLSAPSRVQQEMLNIVDALDIPRAQVHIQAIIVEMSENRAAELGLTWAVDGAGGDQAAVLTNYTGTIGGILQLAAASATGTPDPSLIGDGITAAIGDLDGNGTSWAAVLSALQGDAQTNVMQMPELVVLDNEEGFITVGQTVPFLTGSYSNTGQGGGGAVNPFSTIDREDVGTTLTITPRINEGTGMRLTIAQEVSSLSSSAIASDVITNTRRIETNVFVSDGDILVLGGLMDDQLRENEQRVPGLGRIPGLRWLFRGRNTELTNSSLMVFIRPTILRDSVAASQMTTNRYRYLQGIQNDRAEVPIALMNDSERPALPPLEDGELPPMAAPPSINELRSDSENGDED